MKTFKQFISEAGVFDLEKFKSDCAPALSEIAKVDIKHLPWRGIKNYPNDWEISSWASRTKPRDTPSDLHHRVNDAFNQMMYIEPRNWQFCTGSKEDAYTYSGSAPLTVVFPIGHFEWVGTLDDKFRDLTGRYNEVYQKAKSSEYGSLEQEITSIAKSQLVNEVLHTKWLHNRDFAKCLMSENEIMFKCDKYYCFNVNGNTFSDIVLPYIHSIQR